jgi:hypothetical protein
MKSLTKQRLWQAAICLVCLVLVVRELDVAGPTEFSGGHITGPLFRLADYGWLLFLFGFLISIKYHRIAAVASLLGSLLCFPIFSFILFPGYVNSKFHAQSSIPLEPNVIWHSRSVLMMLGLAIVFYLSIRTLLAQRNPNKEG